MMDVVGLLARAALVFALLGVTLWVVRRVERGRSTSRTSPLQVLASTRLGKGATLAVVRIGTETYALGVTEHSVTMLAPAELPAPEAPADDLTDSTDSTDADSTDAGDSAADGPGSSADRRSPDRPTFAAALSAQLDQLVHPGRAAAGSRGSSRR